MIAFKVDIKGSVKLLKYFFVIFSAFVHFTLIIYR